MAHLDNLSLQLNTMDLGMASMGDRRRLYQALRLRVSMDVDGTIRLSGVFSPDVYLLGLLQDPPDWLSPRARVPTRAGVVTLDNTPIAGCSPSPTTS